MNKVIKIELEIDNDRLDLLEEDLLSIIKQAKEGDEFGFGWTIEEQE